MVGRRLQTASLRHLWQHRWQSLLTILSITLGVAVVVAVGIANQSASRAFKLSMEQMTGRVTHQIVAGASGVPTELYRRLRIEQRAVQSAPVIEGTVHLGERHMTLLGLDPFAEAPFRAFAGVQGQQNLEQLLTQFNGILISAYTAQRLGLGIGDPLELEIERQQHPVEILGLVEGDNPAALDGVLVADIATAQGLLNSGDRLDRIDLILQPEQIITLQDWLPMGVRLVEAQTRTRAMAGMSRAFQTNLTAMSLLALLVGGFLIYNSATFSVLQRRSLFGILRLLGASRAALFLIILQESLLIGIIGTLLGLGVGILLAKVLLVLVTQTINDLYFVLSVSQLNIRPMFLLQGTLLGLLTTLISVAIPAWEATRARPHRVNQRSVIEQQSHRALPWLLGSGMLLLAGGIVLALQPGRSLVEGFIALFILILGYSLMAPTAIPLLSRVCQPLFKRLFGTLGRLAANGIASSLSRTGPAVAALTLAVAATVGMGIMVESFRGSVEAWLKQTMQGDIYISIPHGGSRTRSPELPQALPQLVRDTPGIREISMGRHVQIESRLGPISLLALESATNSRQGFIIKQRVGNDLWQRFEAGELLLISEPLANRRALAVGDSIELLTPGGFKQFLIGGIFIDYGSDQGMMVMARTQYRNHWQDDSVSTLGVFLEPAADTSSVISALEQRLEGQAHELNIRASKRILEGSMAIFDRTFTITEVLRLLVIAVAVVGILSAMMALQLERAREHAILRATGVTPGELVLQIGLQTTLMGLMAGLLALPLGWLMSEVLIHVINLRAFGWSLQSSLPAAVLLQALLLAAIASLIAGIYPGWKMAHSAPAQALREE